MQAKMIKSKIKIKSGDNLVLLNPASVVYIANRESITIICQNDENMIEVPVSIDELDKRLNTFFRIHPDYLINLEYLDHVSEKGNGYVMVGKRHKLPIDKNRVKILMDVLSGFTR